MNNDHKTTVLGALGALLIGLRDGGLDFNKLAHLDSNELMKLGSMVVMILWGWYTNKKSAAKPAESAKATAAGR